MTLFLGLLIIKLYLKTLFQHSNYAGTHTHRDTHGKPWPLRQGSASLKLLLASLSVMFLGIGPHLRLFSLLRMVDLARCTLPSELLCLLSLLLPPVTCRSVGARCKEVIAGDERASRLIEFFGGPLSGLVGFIVAANIRLHE